MIFVTFQNPTGQEARNPGATILKKSLGACGAKSALVSGFGVGKKLKFALTNFFQGGDRGNRSTFSRFSDVAELRTSNFFRKVAKCANPTFYRVRALFNRGTLYVKFSGIPGIPGFSKFYDF